MVIIPPFLYSVTNVGIGLAIFSQRLSRFQDLTIMYVYLGYAGFFLAMVFILFLVYTVIAYTSNEESKKEGGGGVRKERRMGYIMRMRVEEDGGRARRGLGTEEG